jgi:GT2 family glycosyltransferase
MSSGSTPEMSVVIVTPDRYETIRKTMRHLRAQTVKDRLEIVIVAPSAEKLGLDVSDLKDFLQFRVVEVGAFRSTAEARAAGIRQASASVVVFGEDHSFPAPGWAEALIKAHRQPWAAVGPVEINDNPDSLISWADILLNSARWLEPAEATVIDDLPWRNSAYKRALLLDYGSELANLLEAESFLHQDLQDRGYQLYLEPAAKTYHLNFGTISSLVREQFHGGRLFAALRMRRWSMLRRLLYIGGAPLIPLVRLWRILRELRRPGRPHDLLPRILPALMLGLVASAIGELGGYVFGSGNASQQICKLEFHRPETLTVDDRQEEVS